jgi:hypothetical protein
MLKRWVIPYVLGVSAMAAGVAGLIALVQLGQVTPVGFLCAGVLIAVPLGILIPMTIDGGWK